MTPSRFELPVDYLTRRPEAVLRLGDLTVIRHQTGRRSANNQVRISVPMIMAVTNGRKTIHWKDRQLRVVAGEAVFAAPGAYRMSEETDACAALLIFFEPEVVARFQERYPDGSSQTRSRTPTDRAFLVPLTPFLRAGIESLPALLSANAEPSERFLEHKLHEILLLLIEAEERVWPQLVASSREQRTVVRALDSQHSRYRSLPELARDAGQSLSTFKRRFRAATGTTPAAWLRERRLARAKLLLETTGRTVTDIALGVGFNSLSHFARAFRRFYGAAPHDIRKRAKTIER